MSAAALREARAAIDRGELAETTRQLCRAWTSLPSPRIAALAVRASKRLPARELPPAIAAREAAWLELAKTRDREALPTLLAVDWPVHPRGAKARLAELVKFEPDPRIAESLLALWDAERFRSNASAPFWKSAFRTLAAWGEPRLYALAHAEAARSIMWMIESANSLPTEPEIAAPIERELAAIEAAFGRVEPAPASRDALFAAVYAEPEADEPRAVLGDALLADGDPRGELIQLQLGATTAKTRSRIRALLREHAATWTAGVGDARTCEFRRGFVGAVTLDELPADAELARPEWRTVEQLAFVDDSPSPEQLAHSLASPGFATVRTLTGIALTSLSALAQPRTFDRIAARAPLVPLSAMLRVRELALVRAYNKPPPAVAEVFAWLVKQPTVDTVIALELDSDETSLARAATWLRDGAPGSLARIVIGHDLFGPTGWRIELSRSGAIAATWHGRIFGERAIAGLGAAIAAVPRGWVTALTAHAAVRLEPELRDQLERDLAIGATAHGLAAPIIA